MLSNKLIKFQFSVSSRHNSFGELVEESVPQKRSPRVVLWNCCSEKFTRKHKPSHPLLVWVQVLACKFTQKVTIADVFLYINHNLFYINHRITVNGWFIRGVFLLDRTPWKQYVPSIYVRCPRGKVGSKVSKPHWTASKNVSKRPDKFIHSYSKTEANYLFKIIYLIKKWQIMSNKIFSMFGNKCLYNTLFKISN